MNLYQNVHQNGIPNNLVQSLTPDSQNKTNQEVEAGSVNKTTGKEAELNLGKTFTSAQLKIFKCLRVMFPYKVDGVIH